MRASVNRTLSTSGQFSRGVFIYMTKNKQEKKAAIYKVLSNLYYQYYYDQVKDLPIEQAIDKMKEILHEETKLLTKNQIQVAEDLSRRKGHYLR